MRVHRIVSAEATPVRVPARPDSLNSEGICDDDPEFARKFRAGRRWGDFVLEIKWIVEIRTADGLTGVGETYRGAQPEGVREGLEAVLRADVLRLNWRRLPVTDPRVYDALESAVMDLAGKIVGVPVSQLLGGRVCERIECAGWTGRRTPQDAARKAFEALRRGHRVFKVKCSDEDPIRDWIACIKDRCGGRIRVLLDPNQRWKDVDTTLRTMDGVDLEMIYALEDPIERSNYYGFRDLRRRLGVPIFMHIALPYSQGSEDLIAALRERCVDGFNFHGAMFDFVRLAEFAALEGLPCWHGSEVDLGILEASALQACAAAPSCTLPSDIFGELVRVDDLICEPIQFEQGYALVPERPGLGIELDREAAERFRAGESIWLRASGS
jgi:muconate cycloisomerase